MSYKYIQVERHEEAAVIRLDRPKAHNALCTALNLELEAALCTQEGEEQIRPLILTGGDTCFAAGADVKELVGKDPTGARRMAEIGQRINVSLEHFPVPVIAAVNGPALGGGFEMILACDFRILATNAILGLPEVTLGILPGAGGTQRLTRLIGLAKSKELVLLGTAISAKTADQYGLATKLVQPEHVMDEAMALAKKLSASPASSLMLAKQAMAYGEAYGPQAGREFENILFGQSFSSQDQLEGITALLEKRTPKFCHIR